MRGAASGRYERSESWGVGRSSKIWPSPRRIESFDSTPSRSFDLSHSHIGLIKCCDLRLLPFTAHYVEVTIANFIDFNCRSAFMSASRCQPSIIITQCTSSMDSNLLICVNRAVNISQFRRSRQIAHFAKHFHSISPPIPLSHAIRLSKSQTRGLFALHLK